MSDAPKKDAMVGNAADEEQVRSAGRRVQVAELERLSRWAAVAADPAGAQVLTEILDYCGTDRTPLASSSDLTHVLIGKQDVGFFITAQQTLARNRLLPSPSIPK